MISFKHTSGEYLRMLRDFYQGYDLIIESYALKKSNKNKSAWRFFIYLLAVEDSQEQIEIETFSGIKTYNYIDFNSYKLFYPEIKEKALRREFEDYKEIFLNLSNCTFFKYKNGNHTGVGPIVYEIYHDGENEYIKIAPKILYGDRTVAEILRILLEAESDDN
jgi:hypothetical protein